VDAYLLVLDAGRIGGEEEWRVLESLDTRRPLICVVSKIDLWPQAWRRAAALVSEQMAQTRGHEEPRVLGVCLLPEAATDSPQESMRYAVAELCRSESARAGSLQRRAARLANSVSASVEARLAESRADLSAAQDLIQHLQGEHVRLQTSIEELLRDADQVQDAILARAETALNRFAAGTLADALPGGAISGHPEQIEELLSRRMHDTWETVAEDAMTSYEAFVDLCAQRLSKLGWEWEAIGELGRAEWPGNAPTEPVHLKAGPRLSFSAKPRTSDFIRGGVLATVAAFVLPAPFKIIGTRLTSLLAALGAGAAATSLSAGQHESFASSVRNTIEQVSADLATHVKAELAKQFLCLKTALRDAAAEPVDVVRQKLAEAQLALAELEPGLSAAIQQGTERLSELTALSTRVDSMTGGART
jgi:hypothetical protein